MILEQAAEKGDDKAQAALDIFAYRVIKYVGAYAAAMNGVDAIVFTAGIGENDAACRSKVCKSLTYLGAEIDEEWNKCGRRGENHFHTRVSRLNS